MGKVNDKSEQKDSSSRKNTIIVLIVYVALGVVIGFFVGFFTGTESGEADKTLGILELFALVAVLYLSIALHMILHEVGHLIGGLISGYRFSSFRVFNIVFIKDADKMAIKKYGIAGTMGQCLMIPPEPTSNKYPYNLYNLSGGIANFLWGFVFFVFYMLLRDLFSFAGIVFILLIGVGIFIGAANLIPLRMSGIANDGYNVLALKRSESARRAFYNALHINANVAQGVRYKDMPAEWSELPEDFNNPLTVMIALAQFNRLMDNHDFKSAREFAERILAEADRILEIYKNELRCELLFFEIIGECRHEEIERLYTNNLKKYIKASGSHLSKCRLMYAYSKLVTHNEADTSKALKRLHKTFLTFPYKGELELEREMVGIIDSLAK